MKLRSLLLAGALCLAGNSFLSAETRIFTIDRPAMVGNYKLPPGTYRMRVKGDTAEITDLNHFGDKKPVSLTVSRTMGDQTFKETKVVTTTDGDLDRVTEIDLSHSRVEVQPQPPIQQ